MKALRVLPMALVLGLLVGCATQPKPVMTQTNYSEYAMSWFSIDYCNYHGHIDPETAATGRRVVSIKMANYSYDSYLFKEEINNLNLRKYSPPKEECNRLAMLIHEQQQRITLNNQPVKEDPLFNNSNRIKNTYCNTVGFSTLCSTY